MIVAGFGFRGAASVESLRDALVRTGGAPDAVAVPTDKAGAACIQALARDMGVPVIAVPARALRAAQTATCSPRVTRLRGTGSVAEAAALCGAGPGARLLAPRSVSADRMATAALADGPGARA